MQLFSLFTYHLYSAFLFRLSILPTFTLVPSYAMQSISSIHRVSCPKENLPMSSSMHISLYTASHGSLNFSPLIALMNDPLIDVDPDENYYSQLSSSFSCKYYVENTFNSTCCGLNLCQPSFSIFHHNIRSATKNLSDLEIYLDSLAHKFSVVCLSETWFKNTAADLFALEGYVHWFQCRGERDGGGVSIFVKSSLQCVPRKDLSVTTDVLETLFIELPRQSVLPNSVVVGMIYRPPGTCIDTFIEELNRILLKIENERKTCFLSGDFNINLLNVDSHAPTQSFLDNMNTFSYFPLVTKPTRVDPQFNTATLIDNIFCNNLQLNHAFQGVFHTDITDHFPVCVITNHLENETQAPTTFTRKINTTTLNNFDTKLLNLDWNELYAQGSCQRAFTYFHETFRAAYDDTFPLHTKTNKYLNRKPWLTPALKISIKTKNKLYTRYCNNRTHMNEIAYKDFKRTLKRTLRLAERSHYENLMQQHKSNMKKSWSVIKEVINKRNINDISDSFIINDAEVNDGSLIASHFNEFFAEVGPKLARSITDSEVDPLSYIHRSFPNSMAIEPVDHDEVVRVIKASKNSSPGWDGLCMKVLKTCLPRIIDPLVYVLNLSIQEGINLSRRTQSGQDNTYF